MKKVKVMLAGIAVLAVIGGTFAFKAKSAFSGTIFTTVGSAKPAAGACNQANVDFTTTTVQPGSQSLIYYTTDGVGQNCFTTTRYYTTTAL